jgi:hypothetical protein
MILAPTASGETASLFYLTSWDKTAKMFVYGDPDGWHEC